MEFWMNEDGLVRFYAIELRLVGILIYNIIILNYIWLLVALQGVYEKENIELKCFCYLIAYIWALDCILLGVYLLNRISSIFLYQN